jgi:hypothetical protein
MMEKDRKGEKDVVLPSNPIFQYSNIPSFQCAGG